MGEVTEMEDVLMGVPDAVINRVVVEIVGGIAGVEHMGELVGNCSLEEWISMIGPFDFSGRSLAPFTSLRGN